MKPLRVAEDIRAQCCARPVEVGGNPVPITLSIGVAALDAATADVDAAVAVADRAMYDAKDGGSGGVVLGVPD